MLLTSTIFLAFLTAFGASIAFLSNSEFKLLIAPFGGDNFLFFVNKQGCWNRYN